MPLLTDWQRWRDDRPRPTDDPRPELRADHALWATLLPLAHGYGPRELLGVLNGLRCLGAGLTQREGRIVLWRGTMGQGEYEADRGRYLLPNAEQLTMLLKRLQEVTHG